MKKILSVLFLTIFVMLIFPCTSIRHVEANDIYMGEYHNGQTAYLHTSSIRTENHYVQGYHEGDTYRCSVKAVWPNSDQYEEISYEFYIGQTERIKKNGVQIFQTMRGPRDFFDKNPVEKKLCAFFYKKHEQEWHTVPERIK